MKKVLILFYFILFTNGSALAIPDISGSIWSVNSWNDDVIMRFWNGKCQYDKNKSAPCQWKQNGKIYFMR